MMSIETIEEIVEWLKDFRDDSIIESPLNYRLTLWKLTPGLAEVMAKYHVCIGSSLDGPQELNDSQRSEGYYERTMKGYEIAKAHGLRMGFICVFTPHSLKRKEEIFNYFKNNGLSFKVHPALPSLRDEEIEKEKWTLAPEEYGELLVYLLGQTAAAHPTASCGVFDKIN